MESLGSFGEQQFVAYALANELRIEMINVESLEVVAGIDFDRVIKGPVASPDAKHLYLRGNPRLTDHFLVDLATKKQVWEQRWLNDEDGRYIAWHPDGRRLLTGYHARIWDLAARKLKRVPGNNDAAGSLSWSPDGNILATSEGDRVAFYDATTWKRLRETSALPHAMDFAWSPDGEEIAVVSNNDSEGIIRIYDVATAKMNAGIKLQHAPHHSILWNPNGTLLPYGGGAEFYHAKSGELIRRLDWAAMCTASWSPFGKTLAAGFDGARSGGPGVFLFEGITDQAWQIPGTTRLNDYKRSFAWSPDERFLAAVEWDHRVRVFEVNSGEVIASLSGRDIVGDGGLAWKDRSVAWSPDGSTLSVQFKDGKTRLWDTTTWQPIGTLVPLDGEQSLIVGPDGHFVGTQRAKFQIAYIVQTGGRQLFLTADEFAREFDWKNTEDKALATATPYRHSAPLDPSKNSQLIESVNTSAGEPLNAFSLVGRPARIEGVKSWTVDTVGHRHPIVDFKESPNGKWLSSMDRNGGVRLWDTARAQLVKILPTLPGSEAKLAWSPDERQLAIVLNSGAIQVWNVEQGQVVREGESQNKSSVQTAKWSHDGKTLLVCHEDELLLWDTNSWMIKDRSNQVGVFASWSADEKQIASLDAKTGVPLILDANSFEMTVKAEVPRGIPVSWPRGFAWSPVGQRIAVLGSKDLNLWLLDATSGQVIWSQSDLSLQGYPFNPAWSPDGSLLAVLLGAENGSEIMILDGRNGEILSRSIINQFQGGFAPSPAWSSDGRTISIAYPDGTIRFWDVETRKVRLTVDGNRQGRNVSLSTFKANGYLVVDFHYLHTFWDFAKLELVHVGQYSLLRRSPDGITGTSHLCDVFSQKTMGSPIVEAIPLSPPPERSHGQWDSAWSGDGKLFAITNYQRHCVYLYEHATGKLLREFKVVGNEYLESVAIAPDGKTIACGMAYFVALHRADDGELLKTSKGEATRFVSLAYSPDGALLALGRSDGKVQICKSDLSEIVKEFPAHTTSVASFHWTADGRLITGGALGDNTVHIWNPHTGERQGSLAPHRDSQYLSVSSQGHYRAVPRGLFREIRYVVQLEDGSHITLTPAEFEERFGWKNESELVKLPAMK